MPLKQFLQNVFERLGLAEKPLPPPQAVDVTLADAEQLRPIFAALPRWEVRSVRIVAGEGCERADLAQAVRLAGDNVEQVSVRGRASDLADEKLIGALSRARVRELEIAVASAVAEVHDAVVGVGDYRAMFRVFAASANCELPIAVQLVATPAGSSTLTRTFELLTEHGVRCVRPWAIVCGDAAPSSWALSTSDLLKTVVELEARTAPKLDFTYAPLRFDPARTLAQQVRRGPRCVRNAVRIEPDGAVLPPVGPRVAGGNVLQDEWKQIARGEVFRALQRQQVASAPRCVRCPPVGACAFGCLCDEGNWAEE